MKQNLIYILFSFLLCISSCKTEVTKKVDFNSIIGIDVNEKNIAGQPIEGKIKIRGNTNAYPVMLIISGMSNYEKINILPPYAFKLPEKFTEKSGLISLLATQQDSILFKKNIMINAADTEGVIEIFTGPKTIEANSNEKAMTVAIAQDRYGNPVKKSEIQYTVNNPDGTYLIQQTQDNLQSDIILRNSSLTGKALIGVRSDKSNSKESEIKFTPAWPSSFTIELTQHYPYADGRQFFKLKTSEIKDKENNTIENGTMVYFHFTNIHQELTIYSAYTIGGIANIAIENPSLSGTITVSAYAGSAKSNSLNVDFEKSVTSYKLDYNDKTNELVIGPLYGQLKQLVPDGFLVECAVGDRDIFLEEAYNGMCTINLESVPKGKHLIRCTSGGTVESIEIVR